MQATFAPAASTLHDPLKDCASIDELRLELLPRANTGKPVVVFDTSAIFFYEQINDAFPRARYLFVERDPVMVANSLARAGLPNEMTHMAYEAMCETRFHVRRARHPAMSVQYHELDDVRVLHTMWRFFGCLAAPPQGWFDAMIATNIQIPFDVQAQQTDYNKMRKLFASRFSHPQQEKHDV